MEDSQLSRSVGGAQARAVFWWQREEGETFGDVGFEPFGQFLGGGAIFGRQALEQGIGLRPSGRVEDLA